MVVPKLVAIPDVDDAVSQFGSLLIKYLTEPCLVVSVYLYVDGEMDWPRTPDALMPVEGVTCKEALCCEEDPVVASQCKVCPSAG